MKNKSLAKTILILFVVLYCISPVDLAPGPIDDLAVIIIGYLAQQMGVSKHFGNKGNSNIVDVE